MSFQVGGAGALDSFAAFTGRQQGGIIQQQQQHPVNSYAEGSSGGVVNGYTRSTMPVNAHSLPAVVENGVQSKCVNHVGPPSPVSQTDSHDGQQQQLQQPQQQARSFELPVHTVQMSMPTHFPASSAAAPPASSISTPVQAPAPPANTAVAEQPPAAEEAEEEVAPKRTRRTKERIRRIHLPVREGMDELSSSEGSGSEWDEPVLAEGQKLPPGYSGKRRVKKPADGKIKPAYYYPTEGSTRGVPVFEPTYEEFKDFNS